ncbi:glycosyltransferase [uncultured Nonlabens sp.]|uniref:glycosyltransferase family 2 protein n=1 Tax=uncultured Nonlabens sp. TaxID=859306 RepID=UPI0030D9F02F|tara:strand:+ start:57664 stop:58752 length:1089 start_codon:yes stop_codon:yes gene_type:complete
MSDSITIVIPNRNRNLETVGRSLSSIVPQLDDSTKLVVVDYGSSESYQSDLESLINSFTSIQLILCPTQGQLFHKTRAINMVLKDCTTTYFMVLDMDCIVHPNFIKKAMELASENTVYNFPYGFLKEEESKKLKAFGEYNIDFIGGLTGSAIFNTQKLQDLNGFDEFYHNWGAEDADMFDRLERIGVATVLYQEELLLLHQWHEKNYRNPKSKQAFHSHLEKVNHEYYRLSRKRNTTKANLNHQWGLLCDPNEYEVLKDSLETWHFENYRQEVESLFVSLVEHPLNKPVKIKISKVSKSIKGGFKKLINKSVKPILSMEEVNDRLLELVVLHYRNRAYTYEYDRQLEHIQLAIHGGRIKEVI